MKNEFIIVFIGSGLGGTLRFGIEKLIRSWNGFVFPLSTLIVNVLACLILGFIIGLSEQKQILSNMTKIFFTVGFCGGFSTFSTFSKDALSLLNKGDYLTFLLYVFSSVILCLISTYSGILLSEKI